MTALHERLRFDTADGQVLDDTRRYVLLRADVLMGVFDELPEAAKGEALRAFGRSVARHGADSVRAYAAAIGLDGLPAAMEESAASLGWGRWHIETAGSGDVTAPALRLAVENSPFAAAASPSTRPVCHAIAGMLEAVAGALWQRPADARETHCAAQGGATCSFVAVPRAAASLPEPGPARRPSRPPPGDTP